jgi:hypothetical protein
MTFIPVRHDEVIANMENYPSEIVIRVIKEAIGNPSLISPTSAKILAEYLEEKKKENREMAIDKARKLMGKK